MVSALTLSLFGGGSASTGFSIDSSLLTAWAAAKAGIGGTADTVEVGADPNAPTPPWTPGYTPGNSALAEAALGGKAFFDPKAAIYSSLSMDDDYRQLFALYQGLKTMSALAETAGAKDVSKAALARAQAAFTRGLSEFQSYLGDADFDRVNVAAGDRIDKAVTTLAIPTASNEYVTGQILKGSLTTIVPGLDPDAQFDIVVRDTGGTEKTVSIDLGDMGSVTRSLGNVVSFINQRLAAASVLTRIETVNQAPKTQPVKIGSQTVERAYIGPGQWALKLKPQAGETIRFTASDTNPAFYVAGANAAGGRLIKLEDTGSALGQPHWLSRPDATADPIGALIGAGYVGAGAPYTAAPLGAVERRTTSLVSTGENNNVEPLLRAAGEATLKLRFADGRSLSVTTGWRADEIEAWRTRAGETEDQAMLNDLAERLTQLLHEQGVQAGVDTWSDTGEGGFSLFTGDGVNVETLTISGRTINVNPPDNTGYVGGLRDGVYARRFEAAAVEDTGELFEGNQTFFFTTVSGGLKSYTIDGGENGIDSPTLMQRLNDKLQAEGMPAAAELVDVGGALTLRLNATHAVTSFEAKINGDTFTGALQAPGAWAEGGLANASSGQPYGDWRRTYTNTGASPFLTETGALDIAIVVATATGDKTINVSVSAAERLNDPDAAPGEWNDLFQQRLDAALNAAGVYVDSAGSDLGSFVVAEGVGQRLLSVTVNGNAVTYAGAAPGGGVGGAFVSQRSFTTAQGATGVADEAPELVNDPTVSVTFDTVWGAKTVSATLEVGDARTLEMAAQRLNEALAAAGYDIGVGATALSGGGAGLRIVTGGSGSVTGVEGITVGGGDLAATLDAIDVASRADDPNGTLSVAERAARGSAVVATAPASGAGVLVAPLTNVGNWFAGRDFDVSLGYGGKVLAARATATAPDGSVYVLADMKTSGNGEPVKGTRDVALLKYDSAGRLLFSRTLGAADEAQGFSLAVSADGKKVAVAGSVTGALSGAGSAAGKADSFITMYDSDGVEAWTQRRGGSGTDKVSQIAFASDGSIIVAGTSDAALQGQSAQGGQDGYVRGFSAGGSLLFTKQFGTAGEDRVGALLVRDGGGGALDIYTGGVENERGVLRSFTYLGASGLTQNASRDIGAFWGGDVTSLAHDGASLYVAGGVGADRLTVANTARGAVSGQDGFVARLDDDLVSTGQDRVSYLGSAQDDRVTGIAFADGALYALGRTGGVIAGDGKAKIDNTFLARLDDDGEIGWTRAFTSGAGTLTSIAGLSVAQTGASALDRLGLPTGAVQTGDSTKLTARSSLRAGDEFQIGANDSVARRIIVTADDTLATLTRRIASAVGSAGSVRIVKENGAERIEITARTGNAIHLKPGSAGKDALEGLGLSEGVIAVNTKAKGEIRTFGLGVLASDLSLNDTGAVAKAKNELAAALSIIRQAYEALAHPNAKELTAEEQRLEARKQGAVPEYLTRQLSNYQTALTRLGG